VNRRTLGEFGDFAGKAAAVIALLIVVHAVKGKTWTQAHRLWSQPHLATRSGAVWTFTDVCLHLQRLQPMYLSQRVDNVGIKPVIRTPADVLHVLDRSH